MCSQKLIVVKSNILESQTSCYHILSYLNTEGSIYIIHHNFCLQCIAKEASLLPEMFNKLDYLIAYPIGLVLSFCQKIIVPRVSKFLKTQHFLIVLDDIFRMNLARL